MDRSGKENKANTLIVLLIKKRQRCVTVMQPAYQRRKCGRGLSVRGYPSWLPV